MLETSTIEALSPRVAYALDVLDDDDEDRVPLPAIGSATAGGAICWIAVSALSAALLGAQAASASTSTSCFWLLALAIFFVVMQVMIKTRIWIVVVTLLCVLSIFCQAKSRQSFLVQRDFESLVGSSVLVEGRVRSTGPQTVLDDCSVHCQKLNGALSVSSEDQVMPGELVELRGHLERPADSIFPFGSHSRSYLQSRGVYFTLEHARVVSRKPGRGLFYQTTECLDRLRGAILKAHSSVLGESAALYTSMVIGDRVVPLTAALRRDFNRVGLSHLLAASGMNLTIILGFVAFTFKYTRGSSANRLFSLWSARLETLCAVVAITGFSMLASNSPSVFRATLMCLLVVLSRFFSRRIPALSALSISFVAACALDPLSVRDIGLQLSYSATFGVLVLYRPVLEVLTFISPLRGRAIELVLALAAVVLAAQCAVLPIQLFYFGQYSTVFLVANAFAEPVVAPLTVLGFVSTLLLCPALVFPGHSHFFWIFASIAAFCDTLALPLVRLLRWLVEVLGAVPLCTVIVERPALPAVLVIYAGLLLIRSGRVRARLWSGAALLVASGLYVSTATLLAPQIEFVSDGDWVLRRAGRYVIASSLDQNGQPERSLLRGFCKERPEPAFAISGNISDCTVVPRQDGFVITDRRDGLVYDIRKRRKVWEITIENTRSLETLSAGRGGARGAVCAALGPLYLCDRLRPRLVPSVIAGARQYYLSCGLVSRTK